MLQTRTVKPALLELLKELMQVDELKSFNLVGGTALALQYGHRFSEDIDLFCFNSFHQIALQKKLNDLYAPDFIVNNYYLIQCVCKGIKVDLLNCPYPPLFQPIEEDGIRMLQIKDIAPMKLAAIANRGAKKDFFDLYLLLRHFSLEELLALYKEKFQVKETISVIRAIQYFEDAEEDKDPICFKKTSWKLVKTTIGSKVKEFVRN